LDKLVVCVPDVDAVGVALDEEAGVLPRESEPEWAGRMPQDERGGRRVDSRDAPEAKDLGGDQADVDGVLAVLNVGVKIEDAGVVVVALGRGIALVTGLSGRCWWRGLFLLLVGDAISSSLRVGGVEVGCQFKLM
jgi:hypothetical protein